MPIIITPQLLWFLLSFCSFFQIDNNFEIPIAGMFKPVAASDSY